MSFYAREIAKNGHIYRMEHAGFKAELKKATRLVDNGSPHGLPAGESIPVYPIAVLPGAPASWSREAGTYVCPVDSEWGLWFDWTMNDRLNTAVLPSVKGMNPISGLKLDGLTLSEFSDRCPIHDEPFSHANFCQKCGYEWPAQNYVSSPNTLWWDGFRQPDGKVRQFFFSEDESRDIASHVIGKENTVPAFGFGFFRPKNPRIAPQSIMRSTVMEWTHQTYGSHATYCSNVDDGEFGCSVDSLDMSDGSSVETQGFKGCPVGPKGVEGPVGSVGPKGIRRSLESYGSKGITRSVKSVSVGAGAEIRQSLERDNLGVSGWLPEPAAVIRLYFCFREQFASIVSNGGVNELVKNEAGYMKGLPVG